MPSGVPQEKQRQRAPSKRALATRERIMDAAEQVFAAHGFEGASLREARLVEFRRDGKTVYYRLASDRIRDFLPVIQQHFAL